MSSQGQATDLSMDEILASIRKIISEDPKPSQTVAPVRAPVTDGMLNAAQAARQNPLVKATLPSSDQPLVQPQNPQSARSLKPALDEDILDLMDEAKEPVAAWETVQVKPEPINSKADRPAQSEQPSRPGINEMWSPRERPNSHSAAAQAAPANSASAVASNSGEPSEARLEAAIAALGQSLAAPQQSDLHTKSKAAATPPKMPSQPGPRIDVVAVVNAATRAALAQRSADEQMAMPVSAVAPASVAATDEQTGPQATTAPAPMKMDLFTSAPPKPASAAPDKRAALAAASPAAASAVAPAVNAAVEAALAAARAAPARSETQKAPDTPNAVKSKTEAQPSSESAPENVAVPIEPLVADAPKRVIPVPVNSAPLVSSAGGAVGTMAALPQAAALPPPAPAAGVQTLEDTVARLLRPMLRQWLDDNMPRIVEKAFKEELAAQAAPPPVPRIAN